MKISIQDDELVFRFSRAEVGRLGVSQSSLVGHLDAWEMPLAMVLMPGKDGQAKLRLPTSRKTKNGRT